MSSVEDFRKATQDFLAPEMRSPAANLAAMVKEQELMRQEIIASERGNRTELLAVESGLLAAIRSSEQRLSLRIDNALLIEDNAKLLRRSAEYQKPTE